MNIIHISHGGPRHVLFDASGKRWDFEMHPYSGPAVTTHDGEIRATQPAQNSPFWHAVQCWIEQGRKLVGDVCQWEVP